MAEEEEDSSSYSISCAPPPLAGIPGIKYEHDDATTGILEDRTEEKKPSPIDTGARSTAVLRSTRKHSREGGLVACFYSILMLLQLLQLYWLLLPVGVRESLLKLAGVWSIDVVIPSAGLDAAKHNLLGFATMVRISPQFRYPSLNS